MAVGGAVGAALVGAGMAVATATGAGASVAQPARYEPINNPPPVVNETLRNVRRVNRVRRAISTSRCAPNRAPDARVRAATAQGIGEGGVDVGIAGLGCLAQQGCCSHDLAGLTIAALCDCFSKPGLLHGMCAVGRKALDGCDRSVGAGGDRCDA